MKEQFYYEALKEADLNNDYAYVCEVFIDLKTIYHAPAEEQGHARMLEVTEKWHEYYPNAMKSWSVGCYKSYI